MGWVALDDGFFANPKILAAGHAAAGLYAMGLSYCGKYLTDGFIPRAWLIGTPKKLAAQLVETGLWEEVDGGYFFPDYEEYNPSREKVEERRQAASNAASTRWRKPQTDARGNANRNAKGIAQRITPTHAKRNASSNAIPSPIQTPTTRGLFVSKGSSGDALKRLPESHRRELEKILERVQDEDVSTADVLASYAAHLPLAGVAKVRETIEAGNKRVGAGYVVRALQSEIKERGEVAA
jgi:hypothetical protein